MQGRIRGKSKKSVWGLLFLCLCIYGSAMSVKAEDAQSYKSEDGKWKYTILDEQNKAVEIIAAYAAAVDRGAVHVPETITKEGQSYNVQGIGENVFRENKNITSVVIENRIR